MRLFDLTKAAELHSSGSPAEDKRSHQSSRKRDSVSAPLSRLPGKPSKKVLGFKGKSLKTLGIKVSIGSPEAGRKDTGPLRLVFRPTYGDGGGAGGLCSGCLGNHLLVCCTDIGLDHPLDGV